MIIDLITRSWKIIFHADPSPEAIQQARKFLTFGVGMVFARFLSTASQIIMGREFGPEVYGQITMILLISSYFAMPISNGWGLVFTKIAAQDPDRVKRSQALKSLLLIVSLSCLLTVTLLFFLQRPLASVLGIDTRMMQLSLGMTVCYAWWILTKQIAQGFQNWHQYVVIENIWALLVLAGLVVLIVWSKCDLVTVSGTFFIGYLLSGIVVLKKIWQSFFVKIRREYVKDISSHGSFLLLNGLVGVATFSIDRVLLNRSLGVEEVGIYQAHFLSTYGIMSAFMTILITYIFPIFCRNNNMQVVLNKINKIQYPVTVLISIIIGGLVLWMYSYPVSLALFGSLCLFNAVQFHVQLKTWYLASRGVSESKILFQSQLIFLSVNVLMLITLIENIGIVAGGVSLLIAACSSLAYLIRSEHRNSCERIV
ncbi:Membrane protein involved in the export of O-antigen and teichoic acid [Candidatus Electrothrix aarhusensis]|uniref:Membrane protein involved in the export of O-antigen and teichoic acid n=1 Tax=Candidatus Electrothrix aarhusensis TaxID=1859131 RepID=A0A3S3QXU9_9BACT|nr:Membrane protein involved in the export of O-antigen and teichoic acid [Candidatus Electrothrix aarhusensis]